MYEYRKCKFIFQMIISQNDLKITMVYWINSILKVNIENINKSIKRYIIQNQNYNLLSFLFYLFICFNFNIINCTFTIVLVEINK